MKTQYENTAILLIIKGGGGRVSLDGVTACGLVNGADRIQVIAWQSVLLTGLRHGLPAYRYLGGILAWRRGLLSTLWHGDPQPKQFWGRVVCRRKGNRYRCRDYGRVHDRVRHGDPTRMHFRAIPAGRTASRPVHDQSLTDLLPITNRCSDRSSAGLSNR